MTVRTPCLGAIAVLALLLAGCDVSPPDTSENARLVETETTDGVAQASGEQPKEPGAASPQPQLDLAALSDREDPDRLLGFYSAALRAGNWTEAAKAWDEESGIDGKKLAQVYAGKSTPTLALGKGDLEGAAGTIYYIAPIVVTFADGRATMRGTITLRRANDVPGATPQQLNWRIERSTLLEESK